MKKIVIKKKDFNELAFDILNYSTDVKKQDLTPSSDSIEKNPAAVALGRLGGKKGGPARAKAAGISNKQWKFRYILSLMD